MSTTLPTSAPEAVQQARDALVSATQAQREAQSVYDAAAVEHAQRDDLHAAAIDAPTLPRSPAPAIVARFERARDNLAPAAA